MLPVIIIGAILFIFYLGAGISSGNGDAQFISKKWVFKDVYPLAEVDGFYNFSIHGAAFRKNIITSIGNGVVIFVLLNISNMIFKYTQLNILIYLTIFSIVTFTIANIISTIKNYKKKEEYGKKIKSLLITESQMETINYWKSAGNNSAEWREWTTWFNDLAEKITWDYTPYLHFPEWKMDEWYKEGNDEDKPI